MCPQNLTDSHSTCRQWIDCASAQFLSCNSSHCDSNWVPANCFNPSAGHHRTQFDKDSCCCTNDKLAPRDQHLPACCSLVVAQIHCRQHGDLPDIISNGAGEEVVCGPQTDQLAVLYANRQTACELIVLQAKHDNHRIVCWGAAAGARTLVNVRYWSAQPRATCNAGSVACVLRTA